MKRRKFIISLGVISSSFFFLPKIKNLTKDEIFQKLINNIEINYNLISTSDIDKNKFYKNFLNENYDNLEALKIIVKNNGKNAKIFAWTGSAGAGFSFCCFHIEAPINIGQMPILMGASMWVQQKLNPAPADPIQAKIFAFFPLFLTIILASFPSGLVVYWTINNILTIAQQYVIVKKTTVKTN